MLEAASKWGAASRILGAASKEVMGFTTKTRGKFKCRCVVIGGAAKSV
jgi:hypothetical protein